MSRSAQFKRAAFRSQTDEAFLCLLEISHGGLAEPIRLSSDTVDTPHGADVAATFARAATAIDPATGETVAANVPRYKAGGGVLIDGPPATALVFNGFDFAGWTFTGGGQIVSVQQDDTALIFNGFDTDGWTFTGGGQIIPVQEY